jgi:ribose transport system substrate-binding protein
MQKRIITAAALAIVASLTLAACSTTSSASTTASAGTGSASGKKVVYIWPDQESPNYKAISCGAASEAKTAGVDFSNATIPTDFGASYQTPIVNAVIAQHPDAIIISPADAKAMAAPLKKAVDAGIKVVTAGQTLEDKSFLTSAVIGDNVAEGKAVADLLAKLEKGKKGRVSLLGYQKGGSTITDAREEGFEEEIKKYPNLDYIGVTDMAVNLTAGTAAAKAVMTAHPDLIGLVTDFTPNATGANTAVVEMGRTGKQITMQMDSNIEGVHSLEKGQIQGLGAETSRDEGVAAMQQLINSFEGKKVDKTVKTKPVTMTTANVDSAANKKYWLTGTC